MHIQLIIKGMQVNNIRRNFKINNKFSMLGNILLLPAIILSYMYDVPTCYLSTNLYIRLTYLCPIFNCFNIDTDICEYRYLVATHY